MEKCNEFCVFEIDGLVVVSCEEETGVNVRGGVGGCQERRVVGNVGESMAEVLSDFVYGTELCQSDRRRTDWTRVTTF